MTNICNRCIYQEICMQLRYQNIKRDYMNEIQVVENSVGEPVIYVQKCSKFFTTKWTKKNKK